MCRQHLGRRHCIPIHCPSCSLEFNTAVERDEHIRGRSCDVKPPREWDGITEIQKAQLNKRVSTSQSTEENWYNIYEILFPGSPRPRSPCTSMSYPSARLVYSNGENADIDIPLSDELLELREFSVVEGPNIISRSLQCLPEALQPNKYEIRRLLDTMFQDAVGLLLEQFAAKRPAATSTTQTNISEPQTMIDQFFPNGPSHVVDATCQITGFDHSTGFHGRHDSGTAISLDKQSKEPAEDTMPLPQVQEICDTGDQIWILPSVHTNLELASNCPEFREQLDQVGDAWENLLDQAFMEGYAV